MEIISRKPFTEYLTTCPVEVLEIRHNSINYKCYIKSFSDIMVVVVKGIYKDERFSMDTKLSYEFVNHIGETAALGYIFKYLEEDIEENYKNK